MQLYGGLFSTPSNENPKLRRVKSENICHGAGREKPLRRFLRRVLGCTGFRRHFNEDEDYLCPPKTSSDLRREEYLRRLGIRKSGELKPPRIAQTRSRTDFGKLEITEKLLFNVDYPCHSTEGKDIARRTRSGSYVAPDSVSRGSASCESDGTSESSSTSGDANAGAGLSEVTIDGGLRIRSQSTSDLEARDNAMPHANSRQDIRIKFLEKLSYQRVWLPKMQRPPSHQTLIIFDWDNTLLCTTFLAKYQHYFDVLPKVAKQLEACEDAAANLLALAISLGQVLIITNAAEGWVEQSASYWAPAMLPMLAKIEIISARTRFEKQFPDDPAQWKMETFMQVRRRIDSNLVTNIIALGDCEHEMEAAEAMGKEFRTACLKLFKFMENPHPTELLKELDLASQELERVVGTERNIRMQLDRPGLRR